MGQQQSNTSAPKGYQPRTPKNASNLTYSTSGRVGFGPDPSLTTSSEEEDEDLTKRLKQIRESHPDAVVKALREMAYATSNPKESINQMLRFAVNSPSTALEDYQKHLAWRESNPKSTDHDSVFHPTQPTDFPRLWMERGGVAKDGSRLLFSQGARYDKATGGLEAYVKRTWNCVDSIFPDEEVAGMLTVFVDCR